MKIKLWTINRCLRRIGLVLAIILSENGNMSCG